MSTPSDSTTWLDVCASFAQRHAVPEATLELLQAFAAPWPRGGPAPPPESRWSGDFEALEQEVGTPLDAEALTQVLATESDCDQSAMFVRRLAATERILRGVGTPAARILLVGLRVRLEGMLAAPPPRLIRVRALADFYYSHAARMRYGSERSTHASLEEALATLVWEAVAPGIEHAGFDGFADGVPTHVNLLRVDPIAARVVVADLTEATGSGRSMAEAAGEGAAAAISGGFFLYSEPDIEAPSRRHDPVGLLLREGVVENPPVFSRACLLVSEAGELEIRAIGLEDVALRVACHSVAVVSHWHRAHTRVGPDEETVAIVGRSVVAVGRSLPVPLNGFVARIQGDGVVELAPGDTVEYEAPRLASGMPAWAGISGGPTLVRGGRAVLDLPAEDFWDTAPPITFSQDETGDHNLLARMAIGLDGAGRLVAAAVDGRNVERALGMTLGDVSRLLIRVGCTTAMNLDGGSSKRMLVGGRIVDLPSTEIIAGDADLVRVRPVHSAILFQPS